jgi:hypothetical protein
MAIARPTTRTSQSTSDGTWSGNLRQAVRDVIVAAAVLQTTPRPPTEDLSDDNAVRITIDPPHIDEGMPATNHPSAPAGNDDDDDDRTLYGSARSVNSKSLHNALYRCLLAVLPLYICCVLQFCKLSG